MLADRRSPQPRPLASLGQLAGRVAHDFNNLLGVIVNYAAFVAEEARAASAEDPDRWGPVVHDVEQIQRAADRGIALTDRLLAFGRRAVAQPRVLSVNAILADAPRLLADGLGDGLSDGLADAVGDAVGERVELHTHLADDAWPVHADPGQLEQVLMILAGNARDAMPGGGAITFSTDNVVIAEDAGTIPPGVPPDLPPGRYLRLRVADTGTGMTPEVMQRAFEPFFTTKPTGDGTGLGLTTVYGIVVEAGGDVQLSSEPGGGTCVTLLLPAAT